MPIVSANNHEIVKVCPWCNQESTLQINTLTLGVSRGNRKDPDIIELPPCPGCGAWENLKRTWDTLDETKYGTTAFYQQRRAVNTLAQRLKATGRCNPDCADEHAAETEEPPDCCPQHELAGGLAPKKPDRKAAERVLARLHPSERAKYQGGS